MRLTLPLLILLSLFFQACSLFSNSYSVGGFGSGYSNSSNYIQGPQKAKVELSNVTGSDLKFIERLTFIKTFRTQMANSPTITLTSTPSLKLNIVIDRVVSQSKQYKEEQHGIVIYHLDENYKIVAKYTIKDQAGFIPVKGTINYNVFVKAKSGVDYDDAKRVAMKRVFEALAKRVANDISSRGSILASRYPVRTKNYKSTHNTLCPTP